MRILRSQLQLDCIPPHFISTGNGYDTNNHQESSVRLVFMSNGGLLEQDYGPREFEFVHRRH
ncbi:hypothetical protein BLOT_007967 [Blomia tropicalis]|nr:hypothetical protein BLOT_007967 [Blomia tropicalis]